MKETPLSIRDSLQLTNDFTNLVVDDDFQLLTPPGGVTACTAEALNWMHSHKSLPSPSKLHPNAEVVEAQEQQDTIAALPSFNQTHRNKQTTKRRQSSAIFSALEANLSAASLCGGGILSDNEIAVADEDMELFIPLTHNTSVAVNSTNQSVLFIDPDTDDAMLMTATTVDDTIAVQLAKQKAIAVVTDDDVDVVEGRREDGGSKKVAVPEVVPPKEEKNKNKEAASKPRAMASRLKPPSSSSSFFSSTLTSTATGNEGARPQHEPPSRTEKKKSTSSEGVPPLKSSQPVKGRKGKAIAIAGPPIQRVKEQKSNTTIVTTTATRKPLKSAIKPPSWRQKENSTRIPLTTATKPAPTATTTRTTIKPVKTAVAVPLPHTKQQKAASRLRPPSTIRTTKAVTTIPTEQPTAAPPAVPQHKYKQEDVDNLDASDDTPRTAHLKWLEQHPEVAFGGGSKIANAPTEQEVRTRNFCLFVCYCYSIMP